MKYTESREIYRYNSKSASAANYGGRQNDDFCFEESDDERTYGAYSRNGSELVADCTRQAEAERRLNKKKHLLDNMSSIAIPSVISYPNSDK